MTATNTTVCTRWTTFVVGFALLLTFAACGGAGTGPVDAPPSAPLNADLPASAVAPANTVNTANALALMVAVEFGASSSVENTVTVELSDGTTVVSGSAPASAGAGTVLVGPVDASVLADGAIAVRARVSNAQGNSPWAALVSFIKDTEAPLAPVAVSVESAIPVVSGPAIINSSTAPSCVVSVEFGAKAHSSDSAMLYLTDGNIAISSPTFFAPENGGRMQADGLDVSAFTDSDIALSIRLTDAAGNSATYQGVGAYKDTFVAAPKYAFVAQGANNSVNRISAASAADTMVNIHFREERPELNSFQARLMTGTQSVLSAPITSVRGAVSITTPGMDCSSLSDGNVSVEIVVSDPNGNTIVWSATSAMKDTGVGAALAATVAQGASNPADTINIASQNSVMVDINFNATIQLGDAVIITLDGGAASTSFSGTATGLSQQSFGPIDASALPDGVVSIRVDVNDAFGNSSTDLVGTCGKDTVAPGVPTAALIAAGPANPAGYVNQSSVNGATLEAIASASAEPGRTMTVRATSGAQQFENAVPAPSASALIAFTGVNFSAFAEGNIALECWTTDAAGNNSAVLSNSAIKDTVVALPSAVVIAAGPGNTAGSIAMANVANVAMSLQFGSGAQTTDQVSVTLTNGSTLTIPGFNAPAGGGNYSFNADCNTLPDGTVALAGAVTDSAGNIGSFGAWYFLKDTVAPVGPVSVNIPASLQNPLNVINTNIASRAPVQIAFAVAAQNDETWKLTVSSGTFGTTASGNVVPSASSVVNVNTSSFPNGIVNLWLALQDSAGNSSGFAGTSATLDTVAPNMPVAASVAAGANNSASVINNLSVSTVTVSVTMGANSLATDTVSIGLANGASTNSGTVSATAGAGNISFNTLNASALAEGNVILTVTISDANMNSAVFGGTNAIKDTVAPVAPVSLWVGGSAANPPHFVNSTSAGAVSIEATYDASMTGTETASIALSAGGSTVTGPLQSPPAGGGLQVWSGANVAAFSDGPVQVSVTVSDSYGNSAVYSGTAATKDTQAPASPLLVEVLASAQNPIGVINNQTQSACVAEVRFDNGTDPADTFALSMSDGSNTISTHTTACVTGAVQVSFDAQSNADGAQSFSVTVTDIAGNNAVYAIGNALKDTVGPGMPVNALVQPSASNPSNVINLNNVGNAFVSVAFGAGSIATDSVSLALTTLSGQIAATAQAATAGAGTIIFGGLDATTLSEGAVNLVVSATDANMNSTTFIGTLANKDTTNADPISAAHVAASSTNPIDIINSFSAPAVTVAVAFPGTYAGTETGTVTLDDGINAPLVSAPQSIAVGGGVINFNGFNGMLLGEGNITVMVDLNDGNGNTSSHFGSNATKDTIAPNTPTSALVSATAQSPLSTINIATVPTVSVTVSWDNTADPADRYVVTLSDGITSIDSAIGVPMPSASASIAMAAGALLDGPITVNVRMLDPVSNYTNFSGTGATKDTVAPAAPTAASVGVTAPSLNPANFVNNASQSNVSVSLDLSASSVTGELASVTITQGAFTANSVQTAAAGGVEAM
ncbi:MAG: hypothetical protein EXS14_09485, partial [Planctomycetes bacterium]|nr:hypothetical protein [Planctomycetota bacterium]